MVFRVPCLFSIRNLSVSCDRNFPLVCQDDVLLLQPIVEQVDEDGSDDASGGQTAAQDGDGCRVNFAYVAQSHRTDFDPHGVFGVVDAKGFVRQDHSQVLFVHGW